MSYTKQTWRDQESGGTPITADRLNHMEAGIGGANDAWDSISSAKMGIWDVVKRPDGVAICKARVSLSLDLSISYTNNAKFGQIPSYTYPPGLFATPPNVQFFVEPNDHTMWQASHNPGTAQATPPLRMLAYSQGTVPVVINIRAEG